MSVKCYSRSHCETQLPGARDAITHYVFWKEKSSRLSLHARARASRIDGLSPHRNHRPARSRLAPVAHEVRTQAYSMASTMYGSGRGSPTLIGATPTYIRSYTVM